MDGKEIERAAELLLKAQKACAFTGAGVSTESGIPDFRSPGTGLWSNPEALALATGEAFLRDPARFYRFFLPMWQDYRRARPNPAHRALAELEEMGILRGVITQNIDGLHRKAGSRVVWEVHGNLENLICTRCRRTAPFDLAEEAWAKDDLPPRCACGGILRPNIVLFGEPMAPDFHRAAVFLRQGCDLLLVVGSSLTVYPAAILVDYARELIIVNREPTPADDRAAVVLRGQAGIILPKIVEAVKARRRRGC
ncbi:SIR2 family NAD-dependent protein deacylase [Ammonifex thiophilus]|uniref:protein acetyllysine N-acetyltransferase n=1 Tax=Ammonifex thiophilus TaxID=444093 RepID=A0A3D8P4W4_9THEO|nr:NAD-dependent deacylase [Ammonifex thiophilus]RDV84256.1 NAD-dependent deacylase [Ammonifex thiophilus]